MSTPFYLYEAGKRAFERAIQEHKDRLGAGRWDSEAAGRKLVGKIDGLEAAIQILTEEYEKIERLDDEEHNESG